MSHILKALAVGLGLAAAKWFVIVNELTLWDVNFIGMKNHVPRPSASLRG